MIGDNTFKDIKSKPSILIKSYEDVMNKDIYIYNNHFEGESSNNIKFIKTTDIYLYNNRNLSNIKQDQVENLTHI